MTGVRLRILCIGNRYFTQEDDIGPRVYDQLLRLPWPAATEVVDGGLGGLNLLAFFEGPERVVVVDTLSGMAPDGEIAQLSGAQVACLSDDLYDHAAGLPYLLQWLPRVNDGPLPDIVVVGTTAGAPPGVIEEIARICLAFAECPENG
ncbi:MAG: hydrogenase maturation protease [Magnetococcales bacterium]|nr:hydrogenase maturation protease [Magnetococcales bacterium]